jgi:3-hydroxyacyl-[acyl-carrier-protein] dehydratase
VLDYEDVRRLLPQSPPFIFIDRVLDFEAKRRILCLKNVTGNESFFSGHFPSVAIMPGALIGEAIAQASILLFRLSEQTAAEGADRVFVVGTTRTRFLSPVFPGDTLYITVEVTKLLSDAALVTGSVEADGRVVVKSTLTLAAVHLADLKRQRLPAPRERAGKGVSL